MAKTRIPVTIEAGGERLRLDALMGSTETYEAAIPTYPTDEGFSVSDSIILDPATLAMTLYASESPVTWKGNGRGAAHVLDTVEKLKGIYFSKSTVTIRTSDETYENYAIASIEIPKARESGASREIQVSFQQARAAESRTAALPDYLGRGGETGYNAGAASVTAGAAQSGEAKDEESRGSILWNIKNSLLGDGGGGLGALTAYVG
jgi:hypothetical protein